MTDDQMWAVIEAVNWPFDRNVVRCGNYVKRNYGSNTMNQVYNFVLKLKFDFINKFIEYLNVSEIGDDSFDDLACEIISHGKWFYESIKNFDDIRDVFETNEIVESFEYLFLELDDELNDDSKTVVSNKIFSSDDGMCVICTEKEVMVTYNPCNHKICCMSCHEILMQSKASCPMCRGKIQKFLFD